MFDYLTKSAFIFSSDPIIVSGLFCFGLKDVYAEEETAGHMSKTPEIDEFSCFINRIVIYPLIDI